jgi:PKD repeat protein
MGDGNVQPTIVPSTSSPEIGETVLFSIEGVPVDIDSASWDMGGGGCDGADSTPVCVPAIWADCKTQGYKYSSSGTKTVELTIDVGENTFTALPVQVTVQSSGGCDGGGPGVCEYDFSRTSFDIGANDTSSKTLTISTTSSCSWTANAVEPWITILSPSGEITGSGTVRFEVAVNEGPARDGRIYVGGSYVLVNQMAPYVPVNFTMSDTRPDIGEEVTFFVDPILEVASWDFGEPDCRGSHPVIDCSYLPPGACNYLEWTFTSSGEKTITMVLENGESKTKYPIVTKRGQCCLKDGRPTADFEMSADEIYAGETVSFSDTSSKSARGKALGFTWTPANPEIGENVLFNLSGVVGDVSRATWNFGEAGCDEPSTAVCEASLWDNCEAKTFKFASGGAKSVSVDVEIDGAGPETVGPGIVNVASAGSCDGGGGGCSYSLSPKSGSFPAEGGVGSFSVSTTAECEWTATPSLSFIAVTSGEGPGPGRVDYAVSANEGTGERSGLIRVESQSFRVSQSANNEGDTEPTEWWWSITRIEDGEGLPVDEDVYSSTHPTIDFTFVEPGRYRVRLTATNCSGSDFEIEYIDVLLAPVRNFVVASAISSGGANGTQWESDFRFFNPCDESLDVSLIYQPDNVDNSAKQLSSYPFVLGPNETVVFPSVREVVDGYEGEAINGSLLIDSVSDSGCKVLSVSRTFNDTPDGTLGLFVPAMPVTSVGRDTMNFTVTRKPGSESLYSTRPARLSRQASRCWCKATARSRSTMWRVGPV